MHSASAAEHRLAIISKFSFCLARTSFPVALPACSQGGLGCPPPLALGIELRGFFVMLYASSQVAEFHVGAAQLVIHLGPRCDIGCAYAAHSLSRQSGHL